MFEYSFLPCVKLDGDWSRRGECATEGRAVSNHTGARRDQISANNTPPYRALNTNSSRPED